MSTRKGVRGAMTGLLLVGVALASVCQALPMGPEAHAARDAQIEGSVPNDVDRRLVGEVAQEVRRAGPQMIPTVLGIDDTFLDGGSLLHNVQLRDQMPEDIGNRTSWSPRPNTARQMDNGGPDIFKDAINSALRATRDAFFEGGDTANFSLAGMDLNVTLKGDRRGVSINGYELLASNQYGGQGTDLLVQAGGATEKAIGGSEMVVRQYTADASDTITEIRRFVSDPMTIVGVVALFGVWLVFAMASSRARS